MSAKLAGLPCLVRMRRPCRGRGDGKIYSQKLDDESPQIIAGRLTEKLPLALKGSAPDGFHREIVYPKHGIA